MFESGDDTGRWVAWRERLAAAGSTGAVLAHHDRVHIDLGPADAYGHPPGYDWKSERAANDFAAELLMPTDLVREAHQRTRRIATLAQKVRRQRARDGIPASEPRTAVAAWSEPDRCSQLVLSSSSVSRKYRK
jgi:hypothetical protein